MTQDTIWLVQEHDGYDNMVPQKAFEDREDAEEHKSRCSDLATITEVELR